MKSPLALDSVCPECKHVHGEYVGIMDAMAIHGSHGLPEACKASAERFINKMTRRL